MTWKPKEIIVRKSVRDDPVTIYFIKQCPGVPVKYVQTGKPQKIIEASDILRNAGKSMLDKILAGKQVVHVAPAEGVVDRFTMEDDRMMCPHSNVLNWHIMVCFYQCDWCYLSS